MTETGTVKPAHVAVVFVNYTPSPEAKYPVALEQTYAATKWVTQNGQTIHVNSSCLAVVGDSVGSNMVAAVYLPKSVVDQKSHSMYFSIQLLTLVLIHHLI